MRIKSSATCSLPLYPHFKKVTPIDAESIKNFTAKYDPYSDFVFSNIFNWEKRESDSSYSFLNKNLILKSRDNHGGKLVTSMLGKNKINETARELLHHNRKLYYIPEHIAARLDKNVFEIEEDRDNFDYIFEIEKITDIKRPELKKKRKDIRSFMNHHPDIVVKELDIDNYETQKEMFELYDLWIKNKNEVLQRKSLRCELRSFKKFVKFNKLYKSLSIGLYKENKLIAFSINEYVHNKTILKNFVKADPKYSGVFSYITFITSKRLMDMGFKYINNEVDMGLEPLRKSKMEWDPSYFLKKYKVKIKKTL